MVHPWKGPRYNSWLSNTVLSGIALGVIFIVTVIMDTANGLEPPPTYLTGLLGVAAGSFFGAVGTDKSKKDADVKASADQASSDAHQASSDAAKASSRAAESSIDALRAELKADLLAEFAARTHPESNLQMPPPLIPKNLRGEPSEEEGEPQ